MPASSLPLPIAIDVPLRERRTYLHSTNLFDFLVERTGVTRNISLIFRRKIECEVEAIAAAGVIDAECYAARFSGDSDEGRVDLVLVETRPPTPMLRRERYDEDAVAAGCSIEGRAILSDAHNGASAIERIVSLNKRLLTQETDGQRVLVFSKMLLNSLPRNQARLKIVLKARLGNTLFRSKIFADEHEIGEVVFYGI